MLRFYTLGRAEEAETDEVPVVEEHVFLFDGPVCSSREWVDNSFREIRSRNMMVDRYSPNS